MVMRLLPRVNRFDASAAEWRLAAEAVVLTAAVATAVHAVSVRRAVSLASAWGRRRFGSSRVSPDRAARIVDYVAGRLLGQTCLTNAIVLYGLLRRRGMDADIVIGTTQQDGRFAAHAWLRCGDRTLLEGTADSYAPLCRLGAEQP